MQKKIKGVSFFCPAYHDAENIAKVVKRAGDVLSELCDDYEILVVNDGSPDNTQDILARLAASNKKLKVINHPRNLGYARALSTGFANANKFDILLFTDGDNQYDVAYFREMSKYIDDHDAVITRRVKNGNNLARKIISWTFNRILNVIFGEPFTDLGSALRLVKRSVLGDIKLTSTSIFFPVEVIIRLHRKGCRIKEIPIETKRREHGRSTSLLPRNFLLLIKDMLKLKKEFLR